MIGRSKFKEFIPSKEDFGEDWWARLRDGSREVINGQVLVKSVVSGQLWFVVFIAFLGFIYIGNHYEVERLMREVAVMSREVKELRYEAITTSSELMFMSKQSQVLKKINASNIDLEELTEPPRILKVNN